MGKSDPFKDRPKLPSREQIIADLNSAPQNDIVFQEIEECQSLQHMLTGPGDQAETSGITDKPDKETIDNNFHHVTRLLELEAQLKNEPQVLQEKYEHLEKLGQEVSESISELKSAAELVVRKS